MNNPGITSGVGTAPILPGLWAKGSVYTG